MQLRVGKGRRKMKTKLQKGQGLVEFALVVGMMMFLVVGMSVLAMVFLDLHVADVSANAAIHAAQIHVVDGQSCYSEAMTSLGHPTFIMAQNATFTISNCSTDVNALGTRGSAITATWTFLVNPPLPFFYNENGFPMTLHKHYTALYSR